MTVGEVVGRLEMEVLAQRAGLDKEITGGYASDLLSDVIAYAKTGNLWVTLQTHRNIIAVATLKELSAVVLVNGRRPDPETLEKAEEEGITLLGSQLSAFELVGRLYQTGIRGMR